MPPLPALAFVGQQFQSDPNAFGRGLKLADLLNSRRLGSDALGGNNEAFARQAGINPQAAESIQSIRSSQASTELDATKAAQTQRLEGLKLTKRALDVISGAAPDLQPRLYSAALQRLQQAGVDVSTAPQQFDPAFVEQQRTVLQAFQDKGGFEIVNDPSILNRFQEGSVVQRSTDTGKLNVVQAPGKETAEAFGQPQTVVGPDGQPALAQFGNQGTSRAVRGFGPIPDAPKDTGPKISDFASARKEFSALSKSFIGAREGLEKVRQAAAGNSGQNDVALIFGFMKTIDPESTVREGEFATAEQTAGVPERISNLYNRLLTGERLTPEQRAGFVEAAESQFQPTLEQQIEREQSFTATAERQGFDPRNVVTDFVGPLRPKSDQGETLKASALPEGTVASDGNQTFIVKDGKWVAFDGQ